MSNSVYGLANLVAVVVGATLIGYETHWHVGLAVGLLAWALLPVAE
jgi:hypothetical protein